MKANNIKAVIAMTEFFTYHVAPEEFAQITQRFANLEDNGRDRDVIKDLAGLLRDALN